MAGFLQGLNESEFHKFAATNDSGCCSRVGITDAM